MLRSIYKRLPKHIGIIPDGNRRWAQSRSLPKEAGYGQGIDPGLEVFKLCRDLGIPEITFYGFTKDNVRRPADQRRAFQRACVEAVDALKGQGADLLVVGNSTSAMFPPELKPFTRRVRFGDGQMRVNFLVNYGWDWDLGTALKRLRNQKTPRLPLGQALASSDVSRVDLIVRWGGRRRLSGFLPAQSVYADFYVVDALWPDFQPEHLLEALDWYQEQDVTLGG